MWCNGARQAHLSRLTSAVETVIECLDLDAARLAGALCGRAGTSNVIDATVVLAARAHNARAVTGGRSDIARLDPGVRCGAGSW